MQKRTLIIAIVGLILLLGLILLVFQRGAIYFSEGSILPRFSVAALTNPMPSLDRSITYPIDLSEDARAIFARNLDEVKAQITENPANQSAWLDLAIYYRMVNDHAGAVEIWKYLRGLDETDALSRHNLGEYYFHTEKDYAKAEKYYHESIALMPNLQSNFIDLYEMYRFGMQDNEKAIAIMREGIAKTLPAQALPFYIGIANLYRDIGEVENAREYYQSAREIAVSLGENNIVSTIDQELSRLR